MRVFTTIIIILLIAFIGFIGWICVMGLETEVETYTVGMEVIEKDFSSYWKKHSGEITTYIINAKGSGEAFVQEVSPEIYAKYEVGEIIEVEVKVLENKLGNFRKEYEILNLVPLREKGE